MSRALDRASGRPLIVGGALAGSAAAIMLARGHSGSSAAAPLVIERARETGDAICGGFLSWRSLRSLDQLGLSPGDLGGQIVTRMRLFAGGAAAEARLPQPGMGLSRRRLDTLLLNRAQSLGAGVERGVTATQVDRDGVTTRDGARIVSDAVFLATGKHGLRGHLRPPPAHAAADPVIGLRLRMPATARLDRLIDDAVELFLFDRGYAGLVPQEDGSANLCLAVHKSRLTEANSDPATLLAQWGAADDRLGERLAAGDSSGPIDAIAAVPYGWAARADDAGAAGLWRLGDQAAVIPSLAGEGMGIALATGIRAAAAFAAGRSAEAWQAQTARELATPLRVAGMAWRLGEHPRWGGRGVAALAHAPALMRMIARLTRVPGA